MRALVTGGAGFIGSHLVDALVGRGDQVTVLDDLSTGRAENLTGAIARGARLVTGDVVDAATVQRVCDEARPDLVFHLAAQVDVRISVAEPGRDVRINVEGSVNVLEAARRSGVSGVAVASSCAVYGEPATGDVPLAEGAPLRPSSPYGQAKLAAEGYAALFRELHGLRAASLRFGNVYGPRQGAVGEAGVVSIFCRELARGGRPTVFGSGTQTRDFVYVGDVVAALLAAADAGAVGELNVGTARETTVLELVQLLAAAGGRADFTPIMDAPRAGEIERMALDPTRIRSVLGWRERTTLEQGIGLTWAWAAEALAPGPPSPTL